MMLKVIREGSAEFWVYNPLGGRGRHCRLSRDGIVQDDAKSTFYEDSPKCYQDAIKSFIAKETKQND